MQDHRLTYLKVKQKHIATEKNIIRNEELRWLEKARVARERAGHEAKRKSRYYTNLLQQVNDLASFYAKDEDHQDKLLKRNENYLEKVKNMYNHRIDIVRPEARATNIAYGFLRGRKYVEVENIVIENNFRLTGYTPSYGKKKLWNRVFKIVSDFSDLSVEDATREVKAWRKEHPSYREANKDDLE